MLTNLYLAASTVEFSVNSASARAKALALSVITLILIFLCAKALLSHGKQGDYNKSFSVVGAVFICLLLLPLAAGTGATAMGYGDAVLGLVTGFIQK